MIKEYQIIFLAFTFIIAFEDNATEYEPDKRMTKVKYLYFDLII